MCCNYCPRALLNIVILQNILYADGAYVYKSDVEDIINLLENESLNNSFCE